MEIVFLYDFLWYHDMVQADVLAIQYGYAKAKVLDVEVKVVGSVFGV